MQDMRSFLGGRIKLFLGDAKDLVNEVYDVDSLVTDPPYNIGYNYGRYKDNLGWQEYFSWQSDLLIGMKCMLAPKGNVLWLNYPEPTAIMWVAMLDHYYPVEWLTWIYHQHTGGKPLRKGTRAWMWMSNSDDAYIDPEPLKGEYRNPNDNRIKQCIAEGKKPVDMDWWFCEQVKNVSKEKTPHPCQMPIDYITRIVKASCPPDGLVVDFFLGSGTTAEACVVSGRRFAGVENDPKFFEIAVDRIERAVTTLTSQGGGV